MNKYLIFIAIFALGACKSPEARYPVTQKSGSHFSESIAKNQELLEKEIALIKTAIQRDSTREYHSSQDGFWYSYHKKVEDSTTTTTPEFGDIVEFDYSISTLNDEVIYAEGEKATRTYAIDQEKLFSGLRQGLKLMKEGETVTFLFPSYKAFGYYGDKNKIGTNWPLKTKVTLNNITEKEEIQNQQ
ncbi:MULTISPECIES: gliding motility-associated peptidyl-prolyl isomerase GldI [Salegentibacter]|jgi:gliding motility-associated peptidyl-prolyl isomerase|uniref:Peptidyl-prolyl cis-trans isomerase n=1 Tax=Salegentibacter agarivorans TaxID=345907 RepID=A0A1I2L379_9FLAO|nr:MULTISPECIES: gliding motility-associated peptidyl-prolyl isomerase GldI [Salegentibacter]APS40305.1 gliding motility-associated peptidyl-prolyl isomerase GldI [Salegentibacter sp. T436]SFF71907.1 protein involved in gliding motility GldI [Salegentibacter agarivorans]